MEMNRTELQTLSQPAWKTTSRKVNPVAKPRVSVTEQLAAVVCELRNLLEEYAPSWYSLELHNRVESAMERISEL